MARANTTYEMLPLSQAAIAVDKYFGEGSYALLKEMMPLLKAGKNKGLPRGNLKLHRALTPGYVPGIGGVRAGIFRVEVQCAAGSYGTVGLGSWVMGDVICPLDHPQSRALCDHAKKTMK